MRLQLFFSRSPTPPLYLHCLQNLRSCTLSNWFCHWTLPPPHVADNDNAETCASCERTAGSKIRFFSHWSVDICVVYTICNTSDWFCHGTLPPVAHDDLAGKCASCGRDSRQRYSREEEQCLLDYFPHKQLLIADFYTSKHLVGRYNALHEYVTYFSHFQRRGVPSSGRFCKPAERPQLLM